MVPDELFAQAHSFVDEPELNEGVLFVRGRLVEEDDHARMPNHLQEDSDMWGVEAYELRRKYPTLQKAYDQYKTIYKLVCDGEEF